MTKSEFTKQANMIEIGYNMIEQKIFVKYSKNMEECMIQISLISVDGEHITRG